MPLTPRRTGVDGCDRAPGTITGASAADAAMEGEDSGSGSGGSTVTRASAAAAAAAASTGSEPVEFRRAASTTDAAVKVSTVDDADAAAPSPTPPPAAAAAPARPSPGRRRGGVPCPAMRMMASLSAPASDRGDRAGDATLRESASPEPSPSSSPSSHVEKSDERGDDGTEPATSSPTTTSSGRSSPFGSDRQLITGDVTLSSSTTERALLLPARNVDASTRVLGTALSSTEIDASPSDDTAAVPLVPAPAPIPAPATAAPPAPAAPPTDPPLLDRITPLFPVGSTSRGRSGVDPAVDLCVSVPGDVGVIIIGAKEPPPTPTPPEDTPPSPTSSSKQRPLGFRKYAAPSRPSCSSDTRCRRSAAGSRGAVG